MDKASYFREMWEECREEMKMIEEENKDLKSKNTYLNSEVERLTEILKKYTTQQ